MSLLRWIEVKRPVTSSGGLRRAELTDAAAAVGIELSGAARSMGDVERLPALWNALVGAHLLDVGATTATRTALGAALTADPAGQPEALGDVVVAALEELLARPASGWQEEVGLLAIPLLTFAVSREPVTEEILQAAERLGDVRPMLAELTALGLLQHSGERAGVVVTPGLERLVSLAVLQVLQEVSGEDIDIDIEEDDDDATSARRPVHVSFARDR